MRTRVVYDTTFGNTERIARAIAEKLEEAGPAELVAATGEAAFQVDGVDLLVVGGPTQAHRASPTLRALLKAVPSEALRAVPAAAFDTRVRGAKFLTGSAAVGIAKQLDKKGARLLLPPESFLVTGTEGPLVEGEIDRARAWASRILDQVKASVREPV